MIGKKLEASRKPFSAMGSYLWGWVTELDARVTDAISALSGEGGRGPPNLAALQRLSSSREARVATLTVLGTLVLGGAVFFVSNLRFDLSSSGGGATAARPLPQVAGYEIVPGGSKSPQVLEATYEGHPNIWPLPAGYSMGELNVTLSPALTFVTSGAGGRSPLLAAALERYTALIFSHPRGAEARFLRRPLPPRRPWGGAAGPDPYPLLKRLAIHVASANETLQLETNESYSLLVPADGAPACIRAETVYGALRGLETFSQLCIYNFTAKAVRVRGAPWAISDAPRFAHRGLLVDTSRHFEPIPVLKQIVESMAYTKLNVLHWHIVDLQSFPIETPSFPELWRGAYTPAERYTLDDARDLVEYARQRGVMVMPELDVPGHAESWGRGYPQLWPSDNCTMPLDPSSNFTFDVIRGVLSDFKEVFPFRFVHLGGDEVDTNCWTAVPHIGEWLEATNQTAADAFAAFVLRAQRIAVELGFQPVNWEEPYIQFGTKLHNSTIVHEWIGVGAAARAVADGFRTIVSNQGSWYLDWLNTQWPQFYTNDPMLGISEPEQQKLVLGGEVAMWGETVDPSEILQTIWPRAAAAAEKLWTPAAVTDGGATATVTRRLAHFRCLLHQRNIPAGLVQGVNGRAAPPGPGSCYEQ